MWSTVLNIWHVFPWCYLKPQFVQKWDNVAVWRHELAPSYSVTFSKFPVSVEENCITITTCWTKNSLIAFSSSDFLFDVCWKSVTTVQTDLWVSNTGEAHDVSEVEWKPERTQIYVALVQLVRCEYVLAVQNYTFHFIRSRLTHTIVLSLQSVCCWSYWREYGVANSIFRLSAILQHWKLSKTFHISQAHSLLAFSLKWVQVHFKLLGESSSLKCWRARSFMYTRYT